MTDVLEYKCPACNGTLAFDSVTQKMKCPFCDSVFDVSELKAQDAVLDQPASDLGEVPQDDFSWDDSADQMWSDDETAGMAVFSCQSCGGQIVGDSNTGATACPYCGNNVVITDRFRGDLKPNYVIPFKLDKTAAKEKYKQHISKKFLLPKLFAAENHIDEIKGIYVPFWIYDSKVNAFARFEAENTRTWSDSQYNYTEVTTYDVYRSGQMGFEHIPVDGSSKMPDDLMESIEPYDFHDAVPFQTSYLAGFFADKYDVDSKQSEARANERLRQSTIDVLRGTVQGYDRVTSYNGESFRKKLETLDDFTGYADPFAATNDSASGVQMLEGKVAYALYPVYLLTTTYQGEKYTFAMNGQTGKFVGDLPIDKKKKTITFASVFAGATAVATLLLHLFIK